MGKMIQIIPKPNIELEKYCSSVHPNHHKPDPRMHDLVLGINLKEHDSHSETWWWQHQATSLFLYSFNWGSSQERFL